METLLNENLHNTLIVVTRYFGGTLLGTGGLVRAYGQSSKEGIRNSVIQKVCEGISFKLTVDYNSIGRLSTLWADGNYGCSGRIRSECCLSI